MGYLEASTKEYGVDIMMKMKLFQRDKRQKKKDKKQIEKTETKPIKIQEQVEKTETNSTEIEEQIEKTETNSTEIEEQIEKILNKKLLGLGAAFFLACISAAWKISGEFSTITTNITSLSKEIETVNNSITNLNTAISEMDKYLNGNNGVKDQLEDINDVLKIEPFSTTIGTVYIEPNDSYTPTTSITATTCIGTDTEGNRYIAKDFIDQKILLTYKDENKDVYFLGQYNKKYHWDGYCVTNTYNKDGSLYGICESNFDDGERLDYKSFYSSDSSEWNFADRKCEKNSNVGINIVCTNVPKKYKNFTNTNVRVYDILYVDKFLESFKPKTLKHYSGNTSNGLYNDNTGKAYLAIYNDDNTIRTLYVGNFVDGHFEDDTGNAWDIAYSDEGGYYVHNTGQFKKGHALNPSSTPISINEIKKIIDGYDFECKLKWKK